MEESRKKRVIIDVGNIEKTEQLHVVLKDGLDFPDFYGKNWNAFWDAITGLVMLPEILVFINWSNFERCLPEDASYLRKTLNTYNEENPEDDWKVEVNYE